MQDEVKVLSSENENRQEEGGLDSREENQAFEEFKDNLSLPESEEVPPDF